uniref:Uncharacterized protein n=1 Tax=Rhizophora mucronata TaxID=61149 RepID=A0A2P2PFC1_RHIMU
MKLTHKITYCCTVIEL